jgi:competence ComEA-like helix-hairpin-helix protein
VPDHSTYPKEEIGIERVVLFFCVLFFVVQMYSSLSFSKAVIPKESQLSILPTNVLAISSLRSGKNISDIRVSELVDSRDTFHFAPFFFKPIAINYSDKELLMSIRGIGPSLAENILATRNNMGSFSGPEDLLKIKGIGPKRMENFKSYFSFSKDNVQK